ncbi:hypothetical protein P691DRAFT_737567 [Macrolepiota fuliginosa MF-IS2]|uniref:Zn(2)-C6 fungal-type domain-containing protein n=1 Tax=Macrolepiota fuliginosa MF-IS2 TaxID=1400762 RepID=A0A9P6BZK8_9AGAR|nr:hypothetical protein P691DRAFT_737567 [Macrolepiota fuliginosa MF-IS2]
MLVHQNNHRDDSLVHRNKRRGVALSCAECRRLKLKCSRVFPCSNCVKKGCSAICPEGSLTTGKGNRFVLANTEILHEKINQLANRVRQLEDALLESHHRSSDQPHPLLSDDLLQIKRPLERERMDEATVKEEKTEQNDEIDAMGSLSISQGGRSTFFGTTANSWYLLQNEEASDDEDDSQSAQEAVIPTDLSWLTSAFPLNTIGVKTAIDVRSTIMGYLPNASSARKLCELYYRHAAWMYTPITELDFYETVFRPMYDQSAAPPEPLSAHNLAVLFMVLALGSLLDLEAPPLSPQSMQFYQLGRASLTLESVLEEQSIPGIQALLLMCHFMFLSEMGSPRWVTMGIVVKMAHSIGLHRDSGKWNVNAEETHKRRELFYELLTYDSWQSLTYGRPPSLSSAHIDTRFPHGTTTNAQGEVEMSFAAWKHRFSAICLSAVHDQAFGAKAPSYKVITELDKKVRSFHTPPSLQIPGFGSKIGIEVEQPSVELTMQRYITFAIREITLFYMHRGFFAQALEDSPVDPMGSKYGPSVLAAYRSACSFVGLIESLFKQHPGLTERMWFLFTHVFSCSIVLGSIAVKAQMQLAPSALSYLESAYNLFSRVSDNTRTQKILPILAKLRDRALDALSIQKSPGSPPSDPSRHSGANPRIKSEANELSALGGMTRLVSKRSSGSPSYASSPSSQPASPPITHTEPLSPVATYQTSPVEDVQPWGSYSMSQGYGMEVPEYPTYQSVHGVVQQINATPQPHQSPQPQPHQPSLSPQQQISFQQQIPHTHSPQQMIRQQISTPSPISSRMPQHHHHHHHSVVQQQHQMAHHHTHSVSLQQQVPPMSPQTPSQAPVQTMYTGNHIQQLAGGIMPEFFGYGGGNDYNSQMQVMPSPEVTSPPDLNASWYNFMAQFRQ